ncbi:MFS transporter [Tropicimonas sp. S265A]|uniref:MFS transporter n=1 Tax=Tropicimonas sp. S265A TaxID=3415134 RepID=UPI003C7A5858
MLIVFRTSGVLLLGILLLMIGNGIMATLLGVRGAIEGFSTQAMAFVMAAYFAGFLGGSRVTPELIRRVGHVRVFAALGSLISAAMILFPVFTEPYAWVVLRLVVGFCFAGVFVTAESWLNNATPNETRGTAMSIYGVVMMAGFVVAQGFVARGDASGFVLFILPSILVSISFAPILLSVTPAPVFESSRPISLWEVFRASPLGIVGLFLMGGVFSALFGMASVFGTTAGMTAAQISTFVAAIYLGGMLLQFPIGWISDRMDRRVLILCVACVGCFAAALAGIGVGGYPGLLATAFLLGGMANPLYALLVAYTNDYLAYEDMASAAGRMVFVNGVGAVSGPFVTAALMDWVGASGFFVYIFVLMLGLSGYAVWRMSRRPSIATEETGSFTAVSPAASPVAMVYAQEAAYEADEEAAAAS